MEPESTEDPRRRRLPTGWKGPLVVAMILVLVIGGIAFGPWTVAAIRCGNQPVVGDNFASSWTYYLPSDSGYSRLTWFGRHYYCSEDEAKHAGYSR